MNQLQFVDTHTHLDDEQFDSDLMDVVDAANSVGVGRFVNIGYGPDRWASTIRMGAHIPGMSYSLGLHPVSTDHWSSTTFDELHGLVDKHNPVAIGEIGLDYYWRDDNKHAQQESFLAQIDLALKSSLPIVIHQRGSAADVYAILIEASKALRVIFHSFDGDQAIAALARERGWTIGVGGLSTRRQNDGLRAILTDFPLDQIVLETDSPYLVPSGVKSRRNTPSAIPLIAERLAKLREISVEEAAEATTANAVRAFGLAVEANQT